ncbi:MAG: T9SS type A sorting domain-containing protein [Ignavibacteria bacterium]|nr:T9SS type A sorting domain-containing protein [Ignavibacteria bacterium]
MKKIILALVFISCISSSISISQTPFYYKGFPKIVDSLGGTDIPNAIPLIVDLEKDRQKEIIFVTSRASGSMLQIIKSDGSSLKGFPKLFPNTWILSFSSGDVNGDGLLDIALRSKNIIYVIDKFGNSLPGFPVTYYDGSTTIYKFLSLYDLNNDGKLELIVSKTNEVCVFNHDGSIMSGWPRGVVGFSESHPAIGDIDNNGLPEIIVSTVKVLPQGGADSSALHIFRSNGSNFSNNWPIYYDSSYFAWDASPTLYIDRNNPAGTFILINQNGKRHGQYIESRNMKYNIFGQVLSQRNVINTDNPPGSLVIGDLNGDGFTESVNASGDQNTDSAVFLYNNNMGLVNGWPSTGGSGNHKSTPIIGKFTTGSNLNVLANNWTAEYTLPDTGGFIYGYNYDGTQLPWSPLRPIGVINAISASDLNNDGSVELIAISTYTSNETYLHIWTFPGVPYSNSVHPWPQFAHDRYRTNQYGFIPPDEPIGIHPISSNIPAKFKLFQNYPNPFNPSTNIRFDISSKSTVLLNIYDVLGREAATLLNTELSAGEYSVSWDASKFSSGIYFYRINIIESDSRNHYAETKRLTLVK